MHFKTHETSLFYVHHKSVNRLQMQSEKKVAIKVFPVVLCYYNAINTSGKNSAPKCCAKKQWSFTSLHCEELEEVHIKSIMRVLLFFMHCTQGGRLFGRRVQPFHNSSEVML